MYCVMLCSLRTPTNENNMVQSGGVFSSYSRYSIENHRVWDLENEKCCGNICDNLRSYLPSVRVHAGTWDVEQGVVRLHICYMPHWFCRPKIQATTCEKSYICPWLKINSAGLSNVARYNRVFVIAGFVIAGFVIAGCHCIKHIPCQKVKKWQQQQQQQHNNEQKQDNKNLLPCWSSSCHCLCLVISFVCSEVVYRGTDYCSYKDMFHRVEAVGEGGGLKTWNYI